MQLLYPEIKPYARHELAVTPPHVLYADESGQPDGLPVVFIHGAGYLQNAHMGWSGYFREFMFHSFLNKQGYVVADLDYRGSKGYGRDWRTAIYRQMGTPEVEDLVDVTDWLQTNVNVDG